MHGLDVDNYLDDNTSPFIDWHRCNVNCEPFPFQDEVADVIFSFFTFEHLENPWHCVRECTRILKDNGYLILGIPHGFSFWSKLQFLKSGNIAGYRIENNHIMFLPQAVQEKLFIQFSLEDKFYTKPVFPHFPFMNKVLARLVPRKLWGLIANHSFYVYKKINHNNFEPDRKIETKA